MPTQDEYNVTKQRYRDLHVNIYLLNFKLQRVDELSGVVIGEPSFNIDANSDIRRTCSISLTPKNASFDITQGSKIWIDKYVQIEVGTTSLTSGEVVYTNMGVYLVNNPSKTYSATDNTITINGIDMMARLTGLRNGYLNFGEIEYQIPIGSDIKEYMISLLQLAGITKYSVEIPSPTATTPIAISIGLGGTVYDLIAQLRDINANYQTYFDVNGVFHFNQIPSGQNEQVMIDDTIWNKVLLDYSTDVSYETVKNTIEVYGKTQSDGTTPYGFAEDDNPDSPFYVSGTAGVIRIVLSGGEYDNIPTDALAQQRAEYELYLRCKLQDQVNLTCVPIYWADVNWLIEITLPNKQGVETIEQYLIKNISTTLGVNGTQKITMMRYYPLYP